jgi:hypothetical protein
MLKVIKGVLSRFNILIGSIPATTAVFDQNLCIAKIAGSITQGRMHQDPVCAWLIYLERKFAMFI